MAEETTSKAAAHVRGYALTGPCDGKEFMHTEEMRKVKIHDEGKKPHVYIFNEGLTKEQGRRVYLWEHTEAWKHGG
jgi:hypothetical protein